MYCKNCGAEIPEGYKFCAECGAPVPSEEEPKMEETAVASEATETVNEESNPAPVQENKGAYAYADGNKEPSVVYRDRPNQPLALAGFIVSLASLLINPAFVVSIAGLVLSIIGLIKCNKNADKVKGRGMAIAGIVIGGASFVICLLMTIIVVAATGQILDALMQSFST